MKNEYREISIKTEKTEINHKQKAISVRAPKINLECTIDDLLQEETSAAV